MTLPSAVILLLLVMDPFGNLPFFVAALQGVAPERRRRVLTRELLVAYAVMVGFLFAGGPLLGVLGISEPALGIAGGVLLFLIALRMVFPNRQHAPGEDVDGEPFIVPLAIPYVAGPSVLASLLLLMNREPQRWPTWLTALSVAWAVTAIVLLAGGRLTTLLGRRGLIAVERLMGMILVAVSIEMLLAGIDGWWARAAG